MTNMCLGTSIFTFASWAKSFGLFWILVGCIVVAAIDYWSIMNCSIASSKVEEDDFSEVARKILGKKSKVILNILIIIYSYAVLITFYVLIFALFSRFIQSVGFRGDYQTYDEFYEKKWGKAYIIYPFFFGAALILSLISLIKDIKKLNFAAYMELVQLFILYL